MRRSAEFFLRGRKVVSLAFSGTPAHHPRMPNVPEEWSPRAGRAACAFAAVFLLTDAIALLRLRVFSLGVTLPLAIGIVLLLFAIRWNAVYRWLGESRRRLGLWRTGWTLFWLWIATVALFFGWLAQATAQSPRAATPAAAIVVLGSGTPGGVVSPTLASRLDVALARGQASPGASFVTSGGVDFGEARSEGAIMGDYLRAKGVPSAKVHQEERSTSTEQNLLFSREVLRQVGIGVGQASIEVVTSDFHTLRAGWIARRAGYANVRVVGAPTPLYLRYNAWLREYFAVLAGFVLGEF